MLQADSYCRFLLLHLHKENVLVSQQVVTDHFNNLHETLNHCYQIHTAQLLPEESEEFT
jgi:hypothetical protein